MFFCDTKIVWVLDAHIFGAQGFFNKTILFNINDMVVLQILNKPYIRVLKVLKQTH